MIDGLIDGVLSAPPYMVLALAYGLVFGMLGMMDLSVPARFTAAAYGGLLAQDVLARYPPLDPVVWGGAIVAAVLVGIACQAALLPFLSAAPLAMLVASLGVSYALQALMQGLFGVDPRIYEHYPVENGIQVPGVSMTPLQLLSLAYTCAACLFVTILMRRSDWGRRVIAVGGDYEVAATVFGLSRRRVTMEVTLVASLLIAPAALLYATSHGVTATTGVEMGLLAFIATIVAGRGAPVASAVIALCLVVLRSLSLSLVIWEIAIAVLATPVFVVWGAQSSAITGDRMRLLAITMAACIGVVALRIVFPGVFQVPLPGGYQEIVPYAAIMLLLLVRPSGVAGVQAARVV